MRKLFERQKNLTLVCTPSAGHMEIAKKLPDYPFDYWSFTKSQRKEHQSHYSFFFSSLIRILSPFIRCVSADFKERVKALRSKGSKKGKKKKSSKKGDKKKK
jgi:hypothetical protein